MRTFCFSVSAANCSSVPASGLRAALDWKRAEVHAGAQQKTILRIVEKHRHNYIPLTHELNNNILKASTM